jgi:hypothetical protein
MGAPCPNEIHTVSCKQAPGALAATTPASVKLYLGVSGLAKRPSDNGARVDAKSIRKENGGAREAIAGRQGEQARPEGRYAKVVRLEMPVAPSGRDLEAAAEERTRGHPEKRGLLKPPQLTDSVPSELNGPPDAYYECNEELQNTLNDEPERHLPHAGAILVVNCIVLCHSAGSQVHRINLQAELPALLSGS